MEREHGAERPIDDERVEAVGALPEAPGDGDLYRWQMLLGEAVQVDFDEVLAELAK